MDDLKNKNRELLEQVGVISSSLSDLEHRLTSMEKERNLTMIELERFTKVSSLKTYKIKLVLNISGGKDGRINELF